MVGGMPLKRTHVVPSLNIGCTPRAYVGAHPNNNLGIQRFSHLDIPTKYQYLTGITILIPTDGFFDTIIDYD